MPVTQKKKILIADDDAAILDALSFLLSSSGYDVETTLDGEMFKDFKKDLPDLILLDILMSGWDGGVICKDLKSRKETKHIPIILFSANRDTSKIAKEVGADDYISKPFEINDLLSKIKKLVHKK